MITRSEYEIAVTRNIDTKKEYIINALRINQMYLDRIILGDFNIKHIPYPEIEKYHQFNLMMLRITPEIPEIGFGFTDKAFYTMSYRNYDLTSYINLINFNKIELGGTASDQHKQIILTQFKAIAADIYTCPFTPEELTDFIFSDLAFVCELYTSDKDNVYARRYSPNFTNSVAVKREKALKAISSVTGKQKAVREGMQSNCVTNHSITNKYKSITSLDYNLDFKCFKYREAYDELKSELDKKTGYKPLEEPFSFEQNPMFSAMENRVNTLKKPNLSLV